MNIRIATRKSKLALWQANWVQVKLSELGHSSELVLVETQGDQDQRDFSSLEGQGFFTKAVQETLLNYSADLAVHSYKDLPSKPIRELEIAAISERADPRDVLLIRRDKVDHQADSFPLVSGTIVGTGAVRRQVQLKQLRADLEVRALRGNVPTRIEKLRAGDYDAIVLAAAGIQRLDLELSDLVLHYLEPHSFVPAPAQGALALEIHRSEYQLASILTDIHHPPSHKCVAAERGLMAMLQGGCQLALGAYATLTDKHIRLTAKFEDKYASVLALTSETAAMLAYEALGRPKPR
jgi:hydroxymethylbilane synthase